MKNAPSGAVPPEYAFYVRSELFEQLLLPGRPPAGLTCQRIRAARRQAAAGVAPSDSWSEQLLKEQLQVSTQFASSLISLCSSYLARFVRVYDKYSGELLQIIAKISVVEFQFFPYLGSYTSRKKCPTW